MPRLRAVLEHEGFRDVATYVQSGNVVLSSRASSANVAERVHKVITREFGLDITVIVRSSDELAAVLRRNPLAQIATNPRRYIVTFLSEALPPAVIDDLRSVSQKEPFSVIGREIYSWHPDGVGRTPLWERLASKSLGGKATSRNWTTVQVLAAMADPSADR
jgi:uncharacterized protein (DUF1697 family)